MFDTIRKSAKSALIAALSLCLLACFAGIAAIGLLALSGILFLVSCFLYAVVLKPADSPSSRRVAFGLAWLGATLTVLCLGSHFRWLVPCWLAYGGVVNWLLRPPTRRGVVLAGLLTISFLVLPVVAFRNTPLRNAVQEKDVLWAKILLAFGADANEREVHGFGFLSGAASTPVLSEAVEAKDPQMLALLLRHGANPNARSYQDSKFQQDTMHLTIPVLLPAIWNNQPALVNLLLAAGANPLAQDSYGRDAVLSARQYDYPDSVTVQRAAERFRAQLLRKRH